MYVDGFNLFYRCLKGTQYKWLDIVALCRTVFPRNAIHRTRYFTARVTAPPGDPQKPQRQQAYLRALSTIPGLTAHDGTFRSHTRTMPLAHPPASGPSTADVIYVEEKGSDVNLATYLLLDGFRGGYEAAIVVSNDSDLVEPIKVVHQELDSCGHSEPSAGQETSSETAASSCLILPACFGDRTGRQPVPADHD